MTANLELDIQNKIKEIRTGKAEAPEAEVVGEDVAEVAAKTSKKKAKKSDKEEKNDADVSSIVDEIVK